MLRYVLSKGIIGPIIIGRRKCDIGKIISIKILISKIHENLSRERTQYSHRFFQNQFIFFVRHTQVTFGLNINQLYCEVMAHFCGLA